MESFFTSTAECSRPCFSRPKSRLGLRIFAVIALLSTTSLASAQTPKKPVVEEKELITGDELKLKISYYKSSLGEEAPVVILLHGKKGSRQQWNILAADLQSKGEFAVVSVDLRGHGESVMAKKAELLKKTDYQAMVAIDLAAVKEFLLEEHGKKRLNVNKLGIVACDFSASVALLYAELDWEKIPYDDSPTDADRTPRGRDVQALVLISPEANTPGLVTHKAIMAVKARSRPIVIGVSDKNSHDVATATKMYEQLSPKKDKDKDKEKEKEKDEPPYLWKYEGNLSGMDLVARNPNFRGHIFAFLTKYVKEHQTEWRDRRSRLDRD